jgi:hypothetical protein
MRSYPYATHISIGFGEKGTSFASPSDDVNTKASHIAWGTGVAAERLTDFLCFAVGNIRDIVRAGIDEAEKVVGHD